jgi:hypothetical protein
MILRDLQLSDMRCPGPIMTDMDTFAIQVVELYLQHLNRKAQTHGPAKVVVQLFPGGAGDMPQESEGEISFVDWPFNFGALEGVDDATKKRVLLDALHAALHWLAVKHGWNETPFAEAYAATLADKLIFRGTLIAKPVMSPDGSFSATCRFEMRNENIFVFLVLKDRNGAIIADAPVYSTMTRYDAIRRLVGRLRWISNRRIRIEAGTTSWGETDHLVDISELIQS